MSTQRRVGVTRHPDRLAQMVKIRCSAVDVRTTVGLNRLGVVRVQTWMFVVYLAHIKSVSRRRVITQRAATHPCRENHGVVYLQGEELLAVR